MGKRDDHHARTSGVNTWRAGCDDKSHVRFGGRAGETHRSKDRRALRPDPYTHVQTWAGTAYVSFICDVFSRYIVGWRVAANMATPMVLETLEMARTLRGGHRFDGLVCHSDAGAQYTSIRYTERLAELGAAPSIGSVADCLLTGQYG